MHTLFTLEDRYGLEVCECEDEVHLRVHIHKGRDAAELHRMLAAWGEVAAKLKAGDYQRRIQPLALLPHPGDTSGQWHKITPSQELSDMLAFGSQGTHRRITKGSADLLLQKVQQSLFHFSI